MIKKFDEYVHIDEQIEAPITKPYEFMVRGNKADIYTTDWEMTPEDIGDIEDLRVVDENDEFFPKLEKLFGIFGGVYMLTTVYLPDNYTKREQRRINRILRRGGEKFTNHTHSEIIKCDGIYYVYNDSKIAFINPIDYLCNTLDEN